MTIWIPEYHRRAFHRQTQHTPLVDDQDGQRLPNTVHIHLVDHNNRHRHSEGICHLRYH